MPAGQDATIAEVMAKPGRQSRVASRAAIRKDNVLIISMLPQHLHRARRPRYASTKTAPVMPAGFVQFAGFWFAAGAPGSLAREEQPKKTALDRIPDGSIRMDYKTGCIARR